MECKSEKEARANLELDKAQLEQQLLHSQASLQSVQEQLGNLATSLQVCFQYWNQMHTYGVGQNESASRAKFEEAFTRERARGQAKTAELQKAETEAARLKEEWEKDSKLKTETEIKLVEESRRREYLNCILRHWLCFDYN